MNEAKTFEWGGAVFTVSPAKIKHYMQTSRITAVLLEDRPDADDLARYYFSRAVAQTAVEGKVEGWEPPTNDTIPKSFDDWMNLPGELAHLWIQVLSEVDAPTSEAELQPDFEDASDPKD